MPAWSSVLCPREGAAGNPVLAAWLGGERGGAVGLGVMMDEDRLDRFAVEKKLDVMASGRLA
jgi:hypothetical protein